MDVHLFAPKVEKMKINSSRDENQDTENSSNTGCEDPRAANPTNPAEQGEQGQHTRKTITLGSDSNYWNDVKAENTIVWEKHPPIKIGIPTSRHDVMVDLAVVLKSAESSHKGETYSPDPQDKLRVYTKDQWTKLDDEKKRSSYSDANILIKRDKSDPNYSDPNFPKVKGWNRGQLAEYFDLFAYRFVNEQGWSSNFVRSQADGDIFPIPRYELVNDGKLSAFREKVDTDTLHGPTLLPSPSYEGLDSLLRQDVTHAECRNDPSLRLRCAQLDMMLRNKTRYEKGVEDLKNAPNYDPELSILPSPAILNFLDIPMSASLNYSIPTGGLDPLPNLSSTNTPDHPISTKQTHEDYKWGLCGTKWAISDAHVDAAGFGTYIQIVLGTKIWIIGIPDSEDPEACVINSAQELLLGNKVDEHRRKIRSGESPSVIEAPPLCRVIGEEKIRPFLSMRSGFQVTNMRWVAVLLEEGDEL